MTVTPSFLLTVRMKMAVFWVVAPCRVITLMMEAARASETLVNFYQTTWCYNPEDSHLRTHRRENLKSYFVRMKSGMKPLPVWNRLCPGFGKV
jgi:hypothetical protein